MWCMQCNRDLGRCECPDLPERLAEIGQSANIVSRYCRICDKHYALCKCEIPEWAMKSGGKWVGSP